MITTDQWTWPRDGDGAPAGALPAPRAADRDAWSAITRAGVLDDVLRAARDEIDAPWPGTTASAWLRFTLDGDREQYEAAVFTKHAMLGRAVILAASEPTPAALDRVTDGVIAFCEQSSWCWPAHDDAPGRGERLPDIDQPYLDLGAGEVAAALAWTVHVLGPELEAHAPGLMRRVFAEVDRRALTPFLDRDDWHWLGYDGDVHNWLAWICGNVATAALVCEPDTERRRAVVNRALAGLRRYADSLPEDGAIDEGSSYWWNGACRALEALEILEHASGGAVSRWRDHTALRASIRFPGAMHLGNGWSVNVADATARPSQDAAWHSLYRLGRSIGDTDGTAFALSHRGAVVPDRARQLGRVLREVHDSAWWKDDAPSTDDASGRTAWFPSVELLVAHAPTGGGLSLVAKGGHNDEHHNHNDVGSVIVALDGVPVVIDPGRTTYTAQTFSPERYSIWTMQSTWHSTPEVAGRAQRAGRRYAARAVTAERGADHASLTLDLRDAYPVSSLEAWTRTATLSAAGVEVVDRWRFAAAPEHPSDVAMILAGEVRVAAPHRLEVTPVEGDRRIALTASNPWNLESRELTDPMLSTIWGESIVRATCSGGLAAEGTIVVTIDVIEHAQKGDA